MTASLKDLGPRFEKTTGHKLDITFAATPELIKMATSGPFDLGVVPVDVVKDDGARAKFTGTENIARVGYGIAIKAGATKPDVSTPEALKATLLKAQSIAVFPSSAAGAYVLAAIPVAFVAAFAVGVAVERTVVRFLYGRPLETLLATWGISLILIQAVRTIFGAQNVAVENPAWLSGGVQVLPNLTLPYNRIAILVFAALVLTGMALLIARTRLGLFVRGVTQNRRMAACVGVLIGLLLRR